MKPVSPFSIYEIGMHHAAERGGADRYFSDLCRTLRQLGFPVSAAAFGVVDATAPQQISLGSEANALPARMSRLWQLAGRLPRHATPLLATHFALYALPLVLRRPGLPHVVHFHGPWSAEAAAAGGGSASVKVKKRIEGHVYRSASHLITLSNAFARILVDHYGVNPKRIHVIPGGVDLERFCPSRGRDSARELLGWNPKRRSIVCVRRLVSRMGVDKLIEAFSRVAPDFTEWDLLIGGAGPELPTLRDQVQRTDLGSRIQLLGFVPEEKLPTTYRAAEFSMVPSQLLEGFGLVAAESLACGTPAIVTPVGGLPEAVAGLDDERLIAADSTVEGLEGALRRAMSGSLPDSAVCRAHAERNYCWREITMQILDVYRLAILSSEKRGKI